jgi:uncharacterized glyoxalase superfamily protein PhnB
MRIRNVIPMLATGDMEVTIRFYRDALGFELRDRFESGGSTWWCEMMRDSHVLMFTAHEVDVEAPGARNGFRQTSINIYLDGGIEDLHTRLVRGGYPVSDMRVTFYRIREFELTDPSGYTVLIGQPTDEAPTVIEPPAPPF